MIMMMRCLSLILFIGKSLLSSSTKHVLKIEPKPNGSKNRQSLRGLRDGEKKILVTNEALKREGSLQITNLNELPGGSIIPDILEVKLFDDYEYMLFQKTLEWNDDSGYYWYGENETYNSSLDIQVHGEQYTGYATIREKTYSIMTSFDGDIIIHEIDVQAFPNEVEEISQDNRERQVIDRKLYDNNFHVDDGDVIDILCLYTREALVGLCYSMNGRDCDIKYLRYGNAMEDKCQFAVHQTNMIYASSGVQTSLNIVHSGVIDIDYEENESMCAMVDEMRSSNERTFREVRELRDQYRADLVGLIVNNYSYCGCGSMFEESFANDSQAFFVVNTQCATSQFSFAHEVGHTFGCNHNSEDGIDPYANGYQDPESEFRTVMSYNCKDNCRRVHYMSNSDSNIRYNGKAVGDDQHDNTSRINERRKIVSNFRQSQAFPTMSPSQSNLTTSFESISSDTVIENKKMCNWNESLLEITVKTDDQSGHFQWKLSQNGGTIATFSRYHDPNESFEYQTCVLAGACYQFKISDTDGYNNGAEYIITEKGDQVLRGKINGKTDTFPVEGTIRHKIGWEGQSKLECKWLKTQSSWKQDKECSKQYIRTVCPNICNSCI